MNNDGYFPHDQAMQALAGGNFFETGNIVSFADYSARTKKPVRSRLMGYAVDETPKGEVISLADRLRHG